MSEAMPGVPAAPPPTKPRDASAVILYRRVGSEVEVFWLKRDQGLAFAGGFYAFPGGKLDAADAEVSVEGASGHDAQLIVAAARELVEETGVLVAHGSRRLTQNELNEFRRELLAEKRPFSALLAAHQQTLHAAYFKPAGRWVTPDSSVSRFDARFYLVEAPHDQVAEVWPGELSEGAWIRPLDALKQWENGLALLHPPNLLAIEALKALDDEATTLQRLRSTAEAMHFAPRRVEFQRGIRLVPLRTPTLPPATHTNAYILGSKQLLVVDPGSPDETEIDKLIAELDELKAEGCTIEAIVLTHHHADHIGGVGRLIEKLQVPVWAHEKTAERIEWPVAKRLLEGTLIELEGPFPMVWRVLHTPGHARGHVTLIDEATRAAIVGDMVAGVGTIVIDPPEGDMTEYLTQLIRLRAQVGTLYPAHGPAIPNGADKLDEYLTHRAWRENKVFEAVKSFSEPAALSEVVAKAYDDVAAFVWPIAERNTVAILQKLVREGRVIPNQNGTAFRVG